MTNPYTFTDNPMVSGVSVCNTDIVNDNIMALKWMHDHISYRSIGEIVTSTIPLNDSGLHLLDGALISSGGSYSDFVTYISGLVSTYPDLFTTESNWQSTVTQYGVCGKFVYNSTNNTVRLPKYGNQIWSDMESSATVKGNGYALGLTTGNSTYPLLAGAASSGSGNPFSLSIMSTPLDIGANPSGAGYGDNKVIGVATDGSNSGLVADLSNITTSLDCYYYIVVATSTKTDIQVDIDEIATDLNGKADVDLSNCTKPHIVEVSPKNILPRWYRIYSNGWCEQGGHFSINATATETPYAIALSYNFVDANYTANVNIVADGTTLNTYYDDMINIYDKTQSTLYAGISLLSNNPVVKGIDWRAEGYIS